jgi:hypothetical protein
MSRGMSGTRQAHESRSMANRKPYRSKELKVKARKMAYIRKDGAWTSPVEVLYHKEPRDG